MSGGHSRLGRWKRNLGEPGDLPTVVDSVDPDVVDNAVGFAAEHARRYVASDGNDDGWDGPGPIVILYTVGRRSGQTRRNPLLCFEHLGHRHVIGSRGGHDQHPAWYLNLVADPNVHVRFRDEVYESVAGTLGDPERAGVWSALVATHPMFGDYQASTGRQIPVVRLDVAAG